MLGEAELLARFRRGQGRLLAVVCMAVVGGFALAGCFDPDWLGGGTGEPLPPVECTEQAWANPGRVEIPEVVKVEPGAGKGVPFGHALNLEEAGYVEEEFFFSSADPEFTSRFVVLRPAEPERFSGTVYLEWFNVSGLLDVPVMWSASQEYFKRSGHVYVGVSVQAAGANALLDVDPERYATINHPGDNYANTIFSRAGAAIRALPEQILGPGMKPCAVLGIGQSQSSARLTNYVSTTQGTDQVYDVIMLHSGGTPPVNPPVRTFVIRTMNEGNTNGNGPNKIEWDVAGASHNDKRLTENSFDIVGEAFGFDEIPFECAKPMNDYPAYRVYNAALDWMSRWARDGDRPPEGNPFEMDGSNLALDEVGNVKGGVRLPDLDAPTKVYAVDNAPAAGTDLFTSIIGALACGLAGTAEPLSEQQLLSLYPTHQDYVQQYIAAADRALSGGFLLQADYDEMVELAKAAPIPR